MTLNADEYELLRLIAQSPTWTRRAVGPDRS